ncbi:MAG: ExsB family protein [bacterium]
MPDLPFLLRSIKEASASKEIVVAFSGGIDSSLVLFLAVQACGRERVFPAHVDWGPYTYKSIPERVKSICQKFHLEPIIISGQSTLEKILKSGPSCNRCTKKAKLGLIRENFPEHLILTGANQGDSWGLRGKPLMNNVFAPLFYLTKDEVWEIVSAVDLGVQPVGESKLREGCKAKHLLKPLISSTFHGKVVAEANEVLLDFLRKKEKNTDLANVKIVGPLSENIALVNVRPFLLEVEKWNLEEKLLAIKELRRVEFVDSPFRLTIVASPAIYNDPHAREAIESGILSPAFAAPIKFCWIKSENKRLYSFHVVMAERL